jgi:type IV pilus assembly protein PilM
MPSLPKPKLAKPSLRRSRGRRSGPSVVGLDIQPGHVTAVQARVNGSIVAEHAAALPLPADTVREGEVLDEQVLGETLRELFADGSLGRRVRIGVANQRTVLRTLELPPITDRKELAAAVRFQAQDEVPMPLGNAVLDFHALGVHDTPAGPRQQVVLVAAQRDMVQRLLTAAHHAGLRPEGVDMSAFALIRSFYRVDAEHDDRVLYLNVDGLTNMAIAEGVVCRFTRVVGGGLEAMASELAERRGIAVTDARALISDAQVLVRPAPEPPAATPVESIPAEAILAESMPAAEPTPAEASLVAVSDEESGLASEDDVRVVLENGVREIAGEVRNSLDFHRSQDAGGEVKLVVLSGAALDVPGFADALQAELGLPVTRETVAVADGAVAGTPVSPERMAIAAGLSVEEARR